MPSFHLSSPEHAQTFHVVPEDGSPDLTRCKCDASGRCTWCKNHCVRCLSCITPNSNNTCSGEPGKCVSKPVSAAPDAG